MCPRHTSKTHPQNLRLSHLYTQREKCFVWLTEQLLGIFLLKRSNGVDKYAKETLLHIGQSRYALVLKVYKRILILSVSFTIVKIQRAAGCWFFGNKLLASEDKRAWWCGGQATCCLDIQFYIYMYICILYIYIYIIYLLICNMVIL